MAGLCFLGTGLFCARCSRGDWLLLSLQMTREKVPAPFFSNKGPAPFPRAFFRVERFVLELLSHVSSCWYALPNFSNPRLSTLNLQSELLADSLPLRLPFHDIPLQVTLFTAHGCGAPNLNDHFREVPKRTENICLDQHIPALRKTYQDGGGQLRS